MKIESIRILTGANVYSHQSVLVTRLNLEGLKDKHSREISDFNRRLLEVLPKLRGHFCNRGRGDFADRLNEGTHFNHIVEHIAIEMLAQAGFGKREEEICSGDERDRSLAVIKITKAETTRYLMTAAVELVEALLKENSFSVEEKIIEAKYIAAQTELGPSGRTIVEAAEKRGIPWTRENRYSLVQLGYGKNLHFIQAAVTDKTNIIAAHIAIDKDQTKRRLKNFSIPTPIGEVVGSEPEAVEVFNKTGAPVVVKPLNGRQGKGVSLNLLTVEEVINAFRVAQEFSSKVLIEEQYEGKNYRVLVVNGKMAAASERLPCCVVGDGEQTIAELIELENQNPLRGEGHEKPLTKIKLTPILFAAIEKEGWKLDDIPADGEKVLLSGAINLSTGGTAKDVTDEVHQTVKSLCERAARIINLDICGIDLVLEDISARMPKEKGGVIEINSAPGLRMHCFPTEGKPRDVGGAIIEMLYPNNAPSRIPIVAITGTNGKTTVTRMTAHILRETGLNIGTTTTDGILFNGESIVFGDTTGPASAKTILGDKAVDIAVLETARGGILRRGLGWDWADVGVITNITEDHIGQDGIESVEDLVWIKSLVAERVRENGTLILNADDEQSAGLINRPAVRRINKKIVYFALSEKNPLIEPHLEKGETAYFVRDNWIYEASGDALTKIVETTAIPVTMNGTADFQIQNAMAAIAASRALDLSAEKIVNALGEFQGNLHNPGRSNFYRVGKGFALVDYGHNPKAFEAICRMTAQWTGKTIIGIISLPGDRSDEVIKAAGRIAAAGFNRIIVKGDINLRGRERGEIPEMLSQLVLKAGGQSECQIVLDAATAFEQEIKRIQENEVVVFFYEKLAPVLEILKKYNAVPATDFALSAF